MARSLKRSYVDAIVSKSYDANNGWPCTCMWFDICAGKLFYTGKVTDARRCIGGGYTMGSVLIGPASDDKAAPAEEATTTTTALPSNDDTGNTNDHTFISPQKSTSTRP
ncbi:hypothetical protein N656DRAFT_770417 [Canariomyces notabilis]|uniref:Uncharacterized protein n=1 Tax=Canariomyces notabilis TaxID=2074819 RepID=A0AAN6TAU6_9PEZI|nr:hypothetical protein N656DRAFT_770417 [Canariomyces arenarius]